MDSVGAAALSGGHAPQLAVAPGPSTPVPKIFRMATPQAPKPEPTPFQKQIAHARALRQSGRFIEAAQAYEAAAALSPSSNAGLFRAYCLWDAQRPDESVTAFEQYTQARPQDPDGWSGLGNTLKQMRRFEQAIAPFRTALALKDNPLTRNPLIASLWQTGRIDEAQREGAYNLRLKDRLALETFAHSPYSGYRLATGGRGFDPQRRERNIIAFSLWGDKPEYVTGALVNAQIAPYLYIGWTARFYCDSSVPADARALLKGYGAQVVMMDKPQDARIRTMWRFLASDDPEVNVFICRDADSRLNPKELLAVTDWLRSGRHFHVMRDHIYHHELILAGMWGGTAGVLPNLRQWLSNMPAYFDSPFGDQAFLKDMVWPLIRNDVQVHDTYYGFPEGKPFPAGFELPSSMHVGGCRKQMPHWTRFPYSGTA